MIECLADGQAKMNIAYLNAFEIAVKAAIQPKYGYYHAKGAANPLSGGIFLAA